MEPSDNRLVFYERVPQLQDMAAFRIAASLTINYSYRRTDIYHSEGFEKKIYETRSSNSMIPGALEEQIQKYIRDCSFEILRSVLFYHEISFDTDRVAVMKKLLSNIVWKPNRQIDHLNTAFNLLNSAEFDEIFKFRVMCQFCMEEKIRQAWFQLPDRIFIKTQTFKKNPLLVYWDCVMMRDFSKIVDGDYVGSIEKRVISELSNSSTYFPAIEYFFNRLDVEDRIEVGAEIKTDDFDMNLTDRITGKFAKFLIPKYTENEQYRLFSTSGYVVRIFQAFFHSESFDCMDAALETWNHIKHFMDCEQYVEILREMGSWREHGGEERKEVLAEFLVEFWRGTPSNLKEYMFHPERDESMLKFCIYPDSVYEDYDELIQRDSRILIAVLSDADLEYREKFWSRQWENIVERSSPSSWKTILNLCLPYDEIIAFKKKATSLSCIREYFIKIIEVGKFSLLNEFLEMLFDGIQCEIIEAKRKLLEEKINMSYSVECCEQTDEDVAALNDFIKDVCGGDTKAESEFKKKIILGSFCVCGDNCNNYAIMYVSERLCDATLLEELKNEGLKKCRKIDWISGNMSEWNDFLMWCFGHQLDVILEKKNKANRMGF